MKMIYFLNCLTGTKKKILHFPDKNKINENSRSSIRNFSLVKKIININKFKLKKEYKTL